MNSWGRGASKILWQIQAVAAMPDNLSSIPRTHIKEMERTDDTDLCSVLQTCSYGAHVLVLQHKINNNNGDDNKLLKHNIFIIF